MVTIIAGSRTIEDFSTVVKAIEMSGFNISEVVSGGAKGVDHLGERWAKERPVTLTIMPAKWERPDGSLARSAGYKRNEDMAKYADALIAVWDGTSSGTKHMIEAARKNGLRVFVYIVKGRNTRAIFGTTPTQLSLLGT